jgi:hypothetical protein
MKNLLLFPLVRMRRMQVCPRLRPDKETKKIGPSFRLHSQPVAAGRQNDPFRFGSTLLAKAALHPTRHAVMGSAFARKGAGP